MLTYVYVWIIVNIGNYVIIANIYMYIMNDIAITDPQCFINLGMTTNSKKGNTITGTAVSS